ncbi:hypothetical protein [Paenibacillus agilis]|uniref:Uncharacterized protein n=1 Tax=Paenibacillus agilis TaxID=3020863 RepID=A0A559IDV9_9BACL|nr:hypothetical protein [Paenibacillus agilis]TVX85643.1 hypothetical protein FPZ44_25165 [Paenibacillus agilis]
MKYAFEYLGKSKDGLRYFVVITDDGRGLNQQGIDICFHNFVLSQDRSIKKVNYMEVPTFKGKPSLSEMEEVYDLVRRQLAPFVPSSFPLVRDGYKAYKKAQKRKGNEEIKVIQWNRQTNEQGLISIDSFLERVGSGPKRREKALKALIQGQMFEGSEYSYYLSKLDN